MVSGVSEPALQTHNRNSSNLNCAYALTENRRLGRKFPQDLPALDKITAQGLGSGGLDLVLALLVPKAEANSNPGLRVFI